MRVKSKKQLCFVLFLGVLGILACESVLATGVSPDELRRRADILNRKIGLCEQDLAQGAKECLVIVNWEGNRRVSMAEARNLVSLYLNEARQIAAAPQSATLPAWRPEEISNPQIYRIAKSLDSVHVPPPIPSTDASINWSAVAEQTSKMGDAVDYGMLALDVFGKIGSKHAAFKLIVIGSKTLIAGEDGALLFATRQNETYEKALKYLKDPGTSKTFAYMVRDLQEKGTASLSSDPEMLKAAKAIASPSVGKAHKLVLDAFLSPEARTAMLKKACFEIGAEYLLPHVTEAPLAKVVKDLNGRKAIFDAVRFERNKAVSMMKGASRADQYEINRVIAHANKQLERTYRTEQAGPKIMGFFAGQYIYKETEKLVQ